MEQANRGLGRSLVCIQHPASLLCIAVLLLNDHLLKVIAPSWFTGKLSDFTGLFFFPFVVAATVSLLLTRLHLTARQIGALAFALVAICFVLLKIYPLVNILAGQVMSTMLARPAAFTLDPSDLIALAALLPAWWLWSMRRDARSNSLAYVALVFGSLAAVASSPAPMPASVEFFAYDSGVLYASVHNYSAYRSMDDGETWTPCWENECLAIQSLQKSRQLPIAVCDTNSPQLCFRITKNATIDESKDGGKNWFVGWQYSPARVSFLGRKGTPKLEEITPRDLILLPGSESHVLVAMGRAGVLRRSLPEGTWERVHMDYTSYISYTSSDYSSALLDTAGELVIWMLISAALVILAGLQLWIRLEPRRLSILRFLGGLLPPLFGAAAFTAVAGWLVAMILVWVFWSNPFGLPDWMETTWFVFGGATVIIYAAFFLGIQWSIDSLVRKLVDDVKLQRSLLLVLFSMAVANSVMALILWPAWALGIVWDYRMALALAIAGSALILIAGIWWMHRKIEQFEATRPSLTLPA